MTYAVRKPLIETVKALPAVPKTKKELDAIAQVLIGLPVIYLKNSSSRTFWKGTITRFSFEAGTPRFTVYYEDSFITQSYQWDALIFHPDQPYPINGYVAVQALLSDLDSIIQSSCYNLTLPNDSGVLGAEAGSRHTSNNQQKKAIPPKSFLVVGESSGVVDYSLTLAGAETLAYQWSHDSKNYERFIVYSPCVRYGIKRPEPEELPL